MHGDKVQTNERRLGKGEFFVGGEPSAGFPSVNRTMWGDSDDFFNFIIFVLKKSMFCFVHFLLHSFFFTTRF